MNDPTEPDVSSETSLHSGSRLSWEPETDSGEDGEHDGAELLPGLTGLRVCRVHPASAERFAVSDGEPRRIVLARHAETEWSVSGQHTGRTDLALTESGRAKAELIGRGLGGETFARVLTSPLVRASDTCRLAGYGEHAEPHQELLEWDYGDYEGLTTRHVHERRPDWELWQHGAPGGESPEQVAARADRLVAELSRMSAQDGDVLVFGHGHQLRALAVRWIGLPIAAGRRLRFGTGAISGLGWIRETHVIDFWNDRSHLQESGVPA